MLRTVIFGLLSGVILFSPLAVTMAPSVSRSAAEMSVLTYDSIIQTLLLLVAVSGFAATIHTINLRARENLDQRRLETMLMLINTRISRDYRSLLEDRRILFPEYQSINFDEWNAAYRVSEKTLDISESTRILRKRSADSVLAILNHYEFIALCINKKLIDGDVAKSSIRGIMCSFVHDARFVILRVRENSPAAYANLVALYEQWRDKTSRDEYGGLREEPVWSV